MEPEHYPLVHFSQKIVVFKIAFLNSFPVGKLIRRLQRNDHKNRNVFVNIIWRIDFSSYNSFVVRFDNIECDTISSVGNSTQNIMFLLIFLKCFQKVYCKIVVLFTHNCLLIFKNFYLFKGVCEEGPTIQSNLH